MQPRGLSLQRAPRAHLALPPTLAPTPRGQATPRGLATLRGLAPTPRGPPPRPALRAPSACSPPAQAQLPCELVPVLASKQQQQCLRRMLLQAEECYRGVVQLPDRRLAEGMPG